MADLRLTWGKVDVAMKWQLVFMTSCFLLAIAVPVVVLLSARAAGFEESLADRIANVVIYVFIGAAALSVAIPIIAGSRLKKPLAKVYPAWPSGRLEVGDILTLILTAVFLFLPLLAPWAWSSPLAIIGIIAVIFLGNFALDGIYTFGSTSVFLALTPTGRVARIALSVTHPSSLLAIILAQTALEERIPSLVPTSFDGFWRLALFALCLLVAVGVAAYRTGPWRQKA